ncbi:MAG UNVERIFIED_CONTAM: hypothetical protein LVQ98_03180 [Rickettsiaceae bacterium]|jgi:hypothetical protein
MKYPINERSTAFYEDPLSLLGSCFLKNNPQDCKNIVLERFDINTINSHYVSLLDLRPPIHWESADPISTTLLP